MVFIGEEGSTVFPSFWECLVENTATDIVIIDPKTPDYTAITNLVCKPDGYDIKITEVNPITNSHFPAFIEVLNRGATANISACMNGVGDINCSSEVSVPTGSYFVASKAGNYGVSSTLPAGSASVKYIIFAILRTRTHYY